MPDDLEPLPYVSVHLFVRYLTYILLSPFELHPYSDKVQHSESYMLASDVLYASLEESIAKYDIILFMSKLGILIFI